MFCEDDWLEAAYEMRTEIDMDLERDHWEFPGSCLMECTACDGAGCEHCGDTGLMTRLPEEEDE